MRTRRANRTINKIADDSNIPVIIFNINTQIERENDRVVKKI